MRVLVTYNADRVLPPTADLGPSEREEAGLGLTDAPCVLMWCDPIANESARAEGEDERGIPVMRHPETMLTDEPDLWLPVDQWRCGVARELSRDDYAHESNWSVEAWMTMRGAHAREEQRQIEAARRGEE